MKNARFFWDYPATRQEGGPLDPADIVGAEVSLRVQGATDWTVLGTATFPDAEFVQNELVVGDYEARCVVITDGTQRGRGSIISFAVADESGAEAVEGFGVELT